MPQKKQAQGWSHQSRLGRRRSSSNVSAKGKVILKKTQKQSKKYMTIDEYMLQIANASDEQGAKKQRLSVHRVVPPVRVGLSLRLLFQAQFIA